MKKAMRKIIVASVALVAALGLATGTTFAWFSMNNNVTVTGMKVTTQVSSNLFIAEDTLGSTAKLADSLFLSSALNATIDETILEPVSTVNGINFFYTTDAKSDGSKEHDTAANPYVAYNPADTSAFEAAYVDDAKGYVDYVFQLKAVNTEATAQYIRVTTLGLAYTPDASETSATKAHRVAFFVQDITAGGTIAAITASDKKFIYAPSGAGNFDSSAVSSTTGTTAISYDADGNLVQVAANSTKYYKVVVRLYLEGADTTCKNDTFAELNGEWALTVGLHFGVASPANVTALALS
ncbi:MAG: hypothetical protein J6Z34_06315 [Clostridia bacterium]|nr:hypothetical protein [Clostridia bacterium]